MKPALTVFYVVFLTITFIVQAQRPSVRKTIIVKYLSTTTPMYRPQEERRKLPLYPKNTMRFVVTPKPFESKNDELGLNLQTKKPLMIKFIVKERSEDEFDEIPVTRRPLMKAIDSIFERTKPKNIASNNHVLKKRKLTYTDLQNKDFALDDAYAEEVTENDELLFPFSLLDPTVEYNRRKREIRMSEESEVPDCRQPVEEVDLNEFILVKNEESDDLIDAPTYEPRDYETTTKLLEDESLLRPKRHVNIIEEENQATTISRFIYRDRDSKLSNDLLFKNINA